MKKIVLFFVFVGILSPVLFAQHIQYEMGGNFGTNFLIGDSPMGDSRPVPNVGIFGIYDYSSNLAVKVQLGWGQLKRVSSLASQKTSMIPAEVSAIYYISDSPGFRPFFQIGLGIMNYSVNSSSRYFDGIFLGGAGFKLPVSSNMNFIMTADLRYTTGDDFNGYTGGLKDGYASLQAGFSINMGKKKSYERKKIEERKTNVIAAISKPDKSQPDVYLETIQLRSKVDQLESQLREKNAQIEELRTLLKVKNQKIALYQKQIADLKTQVQDISTRPRSYATRSVNKNLVNVKDQYQQALNHFYARRYREAIDEFTQLVQNYPNHRLYGNFIYWIGESYYGLGNIGAALEAFDNVIAIKNSPKQDDALIMAGICFMKLGNSEKAKEKFETLLAKFPGSEYAGKAKRFLQRLQRKSIS